MKKDKLNIIIKEEIEKVLSEVTPYAYDRNLWESTINKIKSELERMSYEYGNEVFTMAIKEFMKGKNINENN